MTHDENSAGHRWHDMGGAPAGRVPQADHDFALWEKRVDALMVLCSGKGYFTVDGLRRVLEDMPPSSFENMSVVRLAGLNANSARSQTPNNWPTVMRVIHKSFTASDSQ